MLEALPPSIHTPQSCTHHWKVGVVAIEGFYPAKCKKCNKTTEFPISPRSRFVGSPKLFTKSTKTEGDEKL